MNQTPKGFRTVRDQVSRVPERVGADFLQRLGVDTVESEYKIYKDLNHEDFEAHELVLHVTGWGEDEAEARATVIALLERFLESKAEFLAHQTDPTEGGLPPTDAVA